MDPIHEDRCARLALAHVTSTTVRGLIARWGSVEAARRVTQGVEHPDLLDTVTAALKHAPADLVLLSRQGIQVVVPSDPEWPDALDVLGADAPVCLFARGELSVLGGRTVAVTGSRAATSYGEHVASDMAATLAGAGVAVLTGGGYGIDEAATRGALAAGGAPVVVLASGVDRFSPSENVALIAHAAGSGLVISEPVPGAYPSRERMERRTELMFAMSQAVLVVEASVRSGVTKAARTDRGRPTFAVPAPITSPVSGTNDLIRDGHATLVRGAEDVLAALTS